MNNEIKEILDNPKILMISYGNYISLDDYVKLKDYITNLQEENDILKRDIEAMKHNYNLLVRLIENGDSITQKFENGLTYQDYKSRNEKAIEYIGNGNIGIPRKTRDKFIAILKGEDKDE